MQMKYLNFFNTTFRNALTASAVLVAGIVITIVITIHNKNREEQQIENDFKIICNDIQGKILVRLQAHAQLLRCGSAMFAASDSISRKDWNTFYKTSYIDRNLPGIQGVGYTAIVPKNRLLQHISEIRKQGFPDYIISPAGDRDIYTSIIYIEPFKGRNLKAFGFDMFSEPIRRRAMEISRDSNIAMLSGKVKLVQETSKDVQAGCLMYVPVYVHNKPIATVEQRRAAIKGWVYSPYRMNDLMTGILGSWGIKQAGQINLRIYDDDKIANEALLFNSEKIDSLSKTEKISRFTAITLVFNGKKWTLHFEQTGERNNSLFGDVLIFLFFGFTISILLFLVILSLLNTRMNAQTIANRLTVELNEEKERFHSLLNSTAEAIYGLDMNGCCTFANEACLKMLGYKSVDVLLGKNMHNQIHHSHADGSHFEVRECKIFKAFQLGKGAHVDDEVLWKADGTCFPSEYWSYPIVVNGKIEGAVVTFVDITERKNSELALKESEEKFRAIFENNSSAMAIIEKDTTISMVNKEYCRIGHYEEKDIIGKSWTTQIPPEDLERLKEYNRLRLEDPRNAPEHYEFSFYRGDGQIRHSLMSVGFIRSTQKIVCSFTDITERRLMEEELLKLSQAVEQSSVSIVITDKNGIIEYVNSKFLEITGYSLDEVVGNNPRILKSGEKPLEEYQTLWGTITSGNEWRGVFHNKKKNGELYWESAVISAIKNGHGEITHFLAVKEDITERKQAEFALKESEERWKFALEGANSGVWDWNMETNKLYTSAQWKEMLGVAEQQISGALEEWSSRVHPDDLNACFEALNLHIEGKKTSYTNVYRIRHISGEYKWVLDRGKIMGYNANGQPTRMIGTITDISERVAMENALRESEAKSIAILHTLPDMVFIQDVNGVYIDCYIPEDARVITSPENFLGKKMQEVLPPDIVERFVPVFEKAIKTKQLSTLR